MHGNFAKSFQRLESPRLVKDVEHVTCGEIVAKDERAARADLLARWEAGDMQARDQYLALSFTTKPLANTPGQPRDTTP